MARPARFEREEILERAMQAFWERGYCATSMAQLVDATGLQPGSLYAAFHSKDELFLAALDHYGERSRERLRQALEAADSPLRGIRDYFVRLADEIEAGSGRRGCLLVNTVLERGRLDAAVQRRVDRHLRGIERLFRIRLEQAQQAGELPADSDPATLARFLMNTIWGLRVLAGSGAEPGHARAVVGQLLRLLGSG